jgi:hypothetical protein
MVIEYKTNPPVSDEALNALLADAWEEHTPPGSRGAYGGANP